MESLDCDLTRTRLRTLPGLLEGRPEVVFAYLFGSAARGQLRATSDVDIAVFLAEGSDPLTARADLIAAVTQHLGTDRVDLVLLDRLPTAVLGRVLIDRIVLCDKDPFRRHKFESLALHQFHDFRIFESKLLERRHG